MILLQMRPCVALDDVGHGVGRDAEFGSQLVVSFASRGPFANRPNVGLTQLRQVVCDTSPDRLRMNCGTVSPLRCHVQRVSGTVPQPQMAASLIEDAGDLVRARIIISDTAANVAGMADGNLAVIRGQLNAGCNLPGIAVRSNLVAAPTNMKIAVAIAGEHSRPQPTGVRLLNARPEAIHERRGACAISEEPTGTTTVARQGRMRRLDGVGVATGLTGADGLRAVLAGHGAEADGAGARRSNREHTAAALAGNIEGHRASPVLAARRQSVVSRLALCRVNYTRSLRVRAA